MRKQADIDRRKRGGEYCREQGRKYSRRGGEHEELTEGSYEELFHDDEQIFAFTRTSEAGKATILVNFSTEEAQYDAACVENVELLLGSNGESVKGTLAPLEAVVYEEVG